MFKPTKFIDFLQEDFPDTSLVAEGLLYSGSRLILGGEPGAGKSYLTLQLLLEAAAGKPWLGIWPLRRPLRCLLIQVEVTAPLLQDRGRRWSRGALVAPNLWQSTSRSFDIEKEADEVEGFCAKEKIDLVAFDPLYYMVSGDENLVHTVRPAQIAFDAIAGDTRAVMLAHHFNKGHIAAGGSPGMHWLRGSSAWAGWSDTILLMVGRPGAPQVGLHVVKARNREAALPAALVLEWQKPGPFFGVVEVRADSELADVMEGLEQAGGTASRTALARHLVDMGYSRTKAYRAIKMAEEQNLVVANGGLHKA